MAWDETMRKVWVKAVGTVEVDYELRRNQLQRPDHSGNRAVVWHSRRGANQQDEKMLTPRGTGLYRKTSETS